MKIKQCDYEYIKTAILQIHTPELYQDYLNQGLSFKRYCFDLLYRAKLSSWLCDTVYKYADDGHIYTAVKHILRSVGVKP